MTLHLTHLVYNVTPATQLHDERVCVLSQQLHVIECVLEHVVVEIVDDMFGHIQNVKSDEEWFLNLSNRCLHLMPIKFSEYMDFPAIMSYPCF